MAIVLLPTGSIYQFTDAETGVYQFAGTHNAFTSVFLNNLTTTSSATVTLNGTTILNGTTTLNGLVNNSAAVKHEYLRVDASTNPTTSLTSTAQFLVSGSFISSNGSADHVISLGSTFALRNYIVNYIKSNNNTNLIRISAPLIGINGQTQWSSSDAYASIQLVYATASPNDEWIITSKVGNWY